MTTIQLKAVKINEALSRDSVAFSATLYIDGKRTAIATDDGWGGCMDFDTYGMPDREAARDRYASAEKAASAASGWEHEALSGFIGNLLARADAKMRKWAARAAKAGYSALAEFPGGVWNCYKDGTDLEDIAPEDVAENGTPIRVVPAAYFTSAPSVEITKEKAVELGLPFDTEIAPPGPRKR